MNTNVDRPSTAHRRHGFGAWLALALLVAVLLAPLVTMPAEAKPGGAHRGGKHCVGQLVAGRHAKNKKVRHQACYRTFAEAQAAATGSGLQGQASNQSVLAILFDLPNYNFNGATYTFWGLNDVNGCSDGTTYSMQTMPSGWNNRISSAKTFSGCRAIYYQDSFLSGSSKTGAKVNGYDIPDFESATNTTSSIRWVRAL